MRTAIFLLLLTPLISFAQWDKVVVKDEMRNSNTDLIEGFFSPTQGDNPKLKLSISKSIDDPERVILGFYFESSTTKPKCNNSCKFPVRFDSNKIVDTEFLAGKEYFAPRDQHVFLAAMLRAKYFFIEIEVTSGLTYQYKIPTENLQISLGAPVTIDLFPFSLGDDISAIKNAELTEKSNCYDFKNIFLAPVGINANKLRACTENNIISIIILRIEDKQQRQKIDSYFTEKFGSESSVLDLSKSWPDDKYRFSKHIISASRLGDVYLLKDDVSEYFAD